MNSDAGVLDGEFGDLMMVTNREPHMPSVGEFEGVGQEVDQDLPQPVLVGLHHGRQTSGPDVVKVDALGGRLQVIHGNDLVEEIG